MYLQFCCYVVLLAKWQHAHFGIDDIIFLATTLDEHLKQIDEILRLPMKAMDIIKLENLHLYSKSIDYLGHGSALWKLQAVLKTSATVKALKHLIKFWKYGSSRSLVVFKNVLGLASFS